MLRTDDVLGALGQVMRQAGAAILRIAQGDLGTAHKADRSPVTEADLAADRILREGLLAARPEAGWLSEETVDDPARLANRWVWIVDPIDGTKEYIGGIPEFSISAALVEDGQPVAGAVYNPSRDELFTARLGGGAWCNGQPIRADKPLGARPTVLASRSELKRGEFAPFDVSAEVRPCGSIAYKLALVAAGQADATWSLGPKNEWDIAAGVLLVQAAGGQVSDRDGEPFVFNRPDPLVNGILAGSAQGYPVARALIGAAAGRA